MRELEGKVVGSGKGGWVVMSGGGVGKVDMREG